MRTLTDNFAALNQAQELEPRYVVAISFDDDAVAGANPNLLTRSQEFDHADWTDLNSPVVTADSDVAPDGTTTADTLEDDNGAGLEAKIQAVTVSDIASPHTFSIFVKKDTTARATRFPVFRLQYQGSTTESNDVDVDTSTGDLNLSSSDSDDVTAAVESYDSDYWRVRITATSNDTANTTARALIYPARGAANDWTQSTAATGSIIIWGAQISESPSALEYVATTTAAATAGTPFTDVTWLTSHADALVLPGVGAIDRIDSAILEGGLGGQTQRIIPDQGKNTIGSVTVRLADVGAALSDKINAKLASDPQSLRRKQIQIYKGHADLTDWDDYTLYLTYIIESIDYHNGVYSLACADIQRTAKTRIFELEQGVLTTSISAADTEIEVTIADPEFKFPLVDHDAIYSSNPSDVVGYVKIDDEIICHDGWTDGNFDTLNVVERGALGTTARRHDVTATEIQQRKKVDEYIYLEMPAPKLIYAILTGVLHSQSASLPDHWHLGIDTRYVRLADFTDIGADFWDTSANSGRLVRFTGVEGIEAKKFVELELVLWLGCTMPVYADGSIGLKRLGNVTPEAGFDAVLTEADIVGYGPLRHDFKSLINNIQVKWNWVDSLQRFTKPDGLIDANSIAEHGLADLRAYEFRGVFAGVHSDSDVLNFFGAIRDRYGNPALRLSLTVIPEWDRLEVGDTVRVVCSSIRDYNQTATLDRVFEIQQIKVDWSTGRVTLELFGGVEKFPELSISDSNVLSDSYYTGSGTELSTVLTISGDAVTASGSLTGAALNTSAIFYYDGPLTINAGVTVTITRNVLLRIKGFLTLNGDIALDGNASDDGALGSANSGFSCQVKVGHVGQTGDERASPLARYLPAATRSTVYPAGIPVFNILNEDGSAPLNVPTDLTGAQGVTGSGARIQNIQTSYTPLFNRSAAGGAGGLGGGGLAIVCRGMSLGASAGIDSSGTAGSAGSSANSDDSPVMTVRGQTGAGGFPGGVLVLIDGDYSAPEFSASNVTANRGAQAVPGTVDLLQGGGGGRYLAPGEEGYGQDIADVFNYWQACTRVQYIPPAENGYTWFPANEELEIPGSPARAPRIFTDTAAGASSQSLTATFGGTETDTDVILTQTFKSRPGADLTIGISGLFDATALGGSASTKAHHLAINILGGAGGAGASIYSTIHGGIPFPTGNISLGINFASDGEGDGDDITVEFVAEVLVLSSGTATMSYNYSNLQMNVIETMP